MSRIAVKIVLSILWIYGTFGFISTELIPAVAPLKSVIFLLCDIVILIFGLIFLKNKIDVILFSAFLLISFISTIIVNDLGFITYLNGLREFIPIFSGVSILRYYFSNLKRRVFFIRKMEKFIFWFMCLQIPCSIFLFLKYGAGDIVGGSMGGTYSGVLTFLCVTTTYYFISQKLNYESLLVSLRKSFLYFIFLVPCFLNETKIVFILLPCMFLLFFKLDKAILIKGTIFVFFSIFVLLPFVFKIYITATNADAKELLTIEYYTEFYLAIDDDALEQAIKRNDKELDVARFTKITSTFELLSKKSETLYFGKGLGHFKGGVIGTTQFSKDYFWLVFGSIPYLEFIVLQVGLLGFAVILILMLSLIIPTLREWKFPYVNFGSFIFLIFIVLLFYTDLLRMSILAFPLLYYLFYCQYNSNINLKLAKLIN